jgi:hypothetical protein
MRNTDRPRSPSLSSINTDPRVSEESGVTTGQLSPELISEAVIASYIHDISVRHRRGVSARSTRRDRGDQH